MKNFLEKVQQNGPAGRKRKKTERVLGLGRRRRRRKKKKGGGGDSKVQSNDSPEIPDREETPDIPGLPSGDALRKSMEKSVCINVQ